MTAKLNISKANRLAIYLRDGMCCAWCGSSVEDDGVILSLDHVIPQIAAGEHTSRNLITSCRKCNSVRGSRSVETFAHDAARYANRSASETIAYIYSQLTQDMTPYRAEAIAIRNRRME